MLTFSHKTHLYLKIVQLFFLSQIDLNVIAMEVFYNLKKLYFLIFSFYNKVYSGFIIYT